ncbi:hypothetical protein GGI19_001957, partial [Coemansia pectinata]
MKTSFAAISCLAIAVLAQTNPMPASDASTSPMPASDASTSPMPASDASTSPMPASDASTSPMPASDASTSPAPKVADTPVVNIVAGQLPQMPQVAQMPQLPQMPQVAQMPSPLTQSLLARLVSYFDVSRLSSVDTATPVIVTQVFDPMMNKFTHLSMNVVQSGDVWYLPVCTVDSITAAAGASAATPPAPESCQYGIQLAPVPQNAMRMLLRVMRTMFRAINAAAMEPT